MENKRTDRAKLRITKANYKEYFPKETMTFPNILGANTAMVAARRFMKNPLNYSQVRYLYISDIIDIMDRRLKKHENSHNLQKNIIVWKQLREEAYALQSSN